MTLATTNQGRASARRLAFVCALLLLLAAGCTGGYSFTGASIPPEAKAIAVETFPNYASQVNPQLSQKLTEDLRDMFSSQTSLNVVNSGAADMELSGQITDYSTRPSAISSGDEAAMYRLSISVKVKFVNNLDEKASYEQTFTRYRDYNASLNFASVEQGLMAEIVAELCEDIFNKAVVNW